ncbi:phosphatase PAP2 family protein [Isoptericola sp. NEAU-Y5]|uniref:Phosphatase PAP2 family protein n=1 Tax=Isoptericola luteus TaxID=2879484 RepID=A0ABS7ZD16_9MICO|nr:phosphatase PAP2 family protein [Isoptericola sp. NEAU-Y5]MCA5892176.1 phosphatase PAP2 family protein [Isoptericola sp. NEAU-Y5]
MLADTRPLPSSLPDPGETGVGAPILPVGGWRDVVTPQPRTAPRVVAGVVAVLAAVSVWLTWRFFVDTAAGQSFDELAFAGASFGQGRLWRVAEPVLDIVSVAFVVAGVGAAVLFAVMRRRWVLALQVAVLVGGANVTTQVLKHSVLARPDLIEGWNGPNTLPSGHTTVAASVSVALLLATPRAWRPVVAVLGVAYAGMTGVSTLVGQWHRPSDVVAALLVVLAFGAAVCAFTPASSLDVPRREGASLSAPASYVTGGLLLLVSVAGGVFSTTAMLGLVRGADVIPSAPDLTAYAAGSLGVLSVTGAVFAVLLVLRQLTARPAAPAR